MPNLSRGAGFSSAIDGTIRGNEARIPSPWEERRMDRSWLASMVLCLIARPSSGQWIQQESGTKARLRGLGVVSRDIAWASGFDSTCLHHRRRQDLGRPDGAGRVKPSTSETSTPSMPTSPTSCRSARAGGPVFTRPPTAG